MTDTTQHRATEGQWALLTATSHGCLSSAILELLARVEALEKGATCPHVVTGDEGTSYCRLAEQQAAKPAPPEPAPARSLVVRVDQAMAMACDDASDPHWAPEARAAIRAVAAAARLLHALNGPSVVVTWEGVAQWLEQEAER